MYARELAFAQELAKEAGSTMVSKFGLSTIATWKADNSPLTKTDVAINRMAIERIKGAFPDDGVLGEELSYEVECERLWTIDPIDGTQAFVLGAPISTFCIALIVDGKPVLGVIYDPYQDRLFRAMEGHGAFVNDQPISVSGETDLAQNFVILSSRMLGSPTTNGILYDAIDQSKGKVFNFRSIAYSMMFVACGRAVAALAGYHAPWDLAPTMIILAEAGATVTDFEGSACRYDENDKGFLATNGHVHDAVLEMLHG